VLELILVSELKTCVLCSFFVTMQHHLNSNATDVMEMYKYDLRDFKVMLIDLSECVFLLMTIECGLLNKIGVVKSLGLSLVMFTLYRFLEQ